MILQHRLLKAAFNNKLLYFPYDSSTPLAMLDSGTNGGGFLILYHIFLPIMMRDIGAWLFDVANEINRRSTLTGIDIQARTFPQSVPGNFSFSINSITALPYDWSNRFDVVHQRLLLASLKKTEWLKATAEMYRVIKPGGYVQLCEPGLWTAGPTTARFLELRNRLYDYTGLCKDFRDFIPDILKRNGFHDIKIVTVEVPAGKWAGQLGCDTRDNFIGVYRALKPHLLRFGCFGMLNSEKELDELYDAVEREWDELKGCNYGFFIAVAKKPNEHRALL
jgi:SAM-dependent methyltransferase